MLLRKASLAKMRALTSLECSTSVCSRDGYSQSSLSALLIALASFTSSSSSRCFRSASTNHHLIRRRLLKCLPENVTFRKGMFTAPSSVRFAAKASSSAGNNNNNNCDDESSEREKVQFEYSENTDPVVNENFIAPNFGYKRQYKGEIICIFGWSRECLRRRHTFTHLSSLLFLRDDIKNSWSRYTQHGRTVSGFRNHHNLRGDVVVCQRHLSIGSDDGRVQRCWDFRESERDFDRPRWTYVSV